MESMNMFFRQIEFYREARYLNPMKMYIYYMKQSGKLWDHLEKQAALGYKFNYGDPEQKAIGEFKMYFNEVLLGDNNMLVELDGTKNVLCIPLHH